MDVKRIMAEIDILEHQVQIDTHSYMMDPECTDIVDSQLNGYAKAILSYCDMNNLIAYSNVLRDSIPIDRNAIEFFCVLDGIKTDILEHSESLQGRRRQQIISSIAHELQESMTKYEIDDYLSGFSVPLSESNYTVNSKRVYVQNTLKDVDGIIIKSIAKDLQLISSEVLETDLGSLSDSEFISQQISKCKAKMNGADFDGAITNARTLIEEVLLVIEEHIQGARQSYDGDLLKLYKRVSKLINMYPNDTATSNSFNEILRGFISVVNGFAGLSNNIADRHATPIHPKKHHAKLAVNSSMILSEFLLESFEYQNHKS